MNSSAYCMNLTTFATRYLVCLKLTSCSTVLLQLVKNFSTFYGTQRFITVFTRASHLFLSCTNESSQSHPISLRSNLKQSSPLYSGLKSGLFHSGFPTKNLYAVVFTPTHATCSTHLILL
jgi:hypothetical protein